MWIEEVSSLLRVFHDPIREKIGPLQRRGQATGAATATAAATGATAAAASTTAASTAAACASTSGTCATTGAATTGSGATTLAALSATKATLAALSAAKATLAALSATKATLAALLTHAALSGRPIGLVSPLNRGNRLLQHERIDSRRGHDLDDVLRIFRLIF